MPGTELNRVRAFLSAFARRQAPSVVDVPGGFAVRDDALPYSHADNQVIIDGDAEPEALPGIADEVLGGLPHRLITVLRDQAGAGCAPALVRAGYTHSTSLIMLHTGPLPELGSLATAAGPVELDAFREPLTRRWRSFLPHGAEEAVRQLVDRRLARLRGADTVYFIGARAEDGEVASWADLYLDAVGGTAQFEDFLTSEAHLRKGYGRAVMAAALHRAADAGCGTRFLLADESDWPRHWYQRLGFEPLGRVHSFERG
ncbi:GNAT family N-acetyltransferase [Streptomyces sp. SBT349]|uniref:GNAT family N-acetyltransferase n=1 Tax=Streptomyces sp. SBT349 TaxID=1580539 RepID=UPI00066C723E|nr:GNAT family N-acetyltransferase [Streptomyces sp. SBT349]